MPGRTLLDITITLYSKPDCPGCTATKRKFAQLSIPYTEVDISADPEALAVLKAQGYLSVPVVVLSNGESWAGFRPDLIKYIKEGM